MVTFIGDGSSTSTTGSTGNDTIFGGGGSDTIFGGMGADSLGAGTNTTGTGTQADDMTYIYGGQGVDNIYSGTAGSNYLSGDLDGDTIHVLNGLTAATILGGQGNDSIDASATDGGSNLLIYGDDNTATTIGGNDTIQTGLSNATVFGGQGADSIVGGAEVSGGSSALYGGQGADTITSAALGGVTLYGGQNDDHLTVSGSGGTAGTDQHWIFGNLGNDIITVSGDSATVFGGQGFDSITAAGSTQNNVLHGDLGNDTIIAGTASDTIYGGFGADSLVSGTTAMGGTAHGVTFYDNQGETSVARESVTAADGSTQFVYDQTNLDVISGFRTGTDHIALAGHTTLVNTGNIVTGNYTTNGDYGTFQAAYDAAYGNQTGTNNGYFSAAPGVEYLKETVTAGGTTTTYLFVNSTDSNGNHEAVSFNGNIAFATNDVIAG